MRKHGHGSAVGQSDRPQVWGSCYPPSVEGGFASARGLLPGLVLTVELPQAFPCREGVGSPWRPGSALWHQGFLALVVETCALLPRLCAICPLAVWPGSAARPFGGQKAHLGEVTEIPLSCGQCYARCLWPCEPRIWRRPGAGIQRNWREWDCGVSGNGVWERWLSPGVLSSGLSPEL